MTRKGTVCKEKPNSLIVMTGDFEFVEIKKKEPVPAGRQVFFEKGDIYPRSRRRPLALVASLLIVLLLATSLLYQALLPGAYAYVGLDVNPGLELAVDENLRVIETITVGGGKQNQAKVPPVEGLHLKEAVGKILAAGLEQGYINKDHPCIIMTATVNAAGNQQVEVELEKQLLDCAREKLEQERLEADIYVLQVPPRIRNQALEKDIPPGRYLVWEKARQSGVELPLEDDITTLMSNNKQMRAAVAECAAARWEKAPDRASNRQNQPTGAVKNDRGKDWANGKKAGIEKQEQGVNPGGKEIVDPQAPAGKKGAGGQKEKVTPGKGPAQARDNAPNLPPGQAKDRDSAPNPPPGQAKDRDTTPANQGGGNDRHSAPAKQQGPENGNPFPAPKEQGPPFVNHPGRGPDNKK